MFTVGTNPIGVATFELIVEIVFNKQNKTKNCYLPLFFCVRQETPNIRHQRINKSTNQTSTNRNEIDHRYSEADRQQRERRRRCTALVACHVIVTFSNRFELCLCLKKERLFRISRFFCCRTMSTVVVAT